jgi:carbamoyl-phosphate synthase large subunit
VTFNVAISSAGRRVALLRGFRAALQSAGIPGRVLAMEISTMAAAFHDADAGILVPHCLDADFVPRVLEVCAQERINLLIPTIDTELPIYAAHRDDFAAIGTHVVISSVEVVEICADKRRTHAFLTAHGLPTVHQRTLEEGIDAAMHFPLIVKPAVGSSSVGVRTVANKEQLDASWGECDLIVQSIAPGREYTIDVYIDEHGACQCAVPRRRIEVRAGEVSKAATARSPELRGIARDVVSALPGARGVITIQVFFDPTRGQVNVIEINPRFGGGYPLSLAAGADFPRWLVEAALGRHPEIDPDAWLDGMLMLRYDDAIFLRDGYGGSA